MVISFFSDISPSFKGESIYLLIAFLTLDLGINTFERLSYTETIHYNDSSASAQLYYNVFFPACSLAYFLAFYGYFFDLLATGDIISPTHPATCCRGFTDFGYSTSCRDAPSYARATIGRPGFTCNTFSFYFGGFLPL